MKRKATAIVAFVFILTMAVLPTKVYSINDEYESLEFYLDQALKQTKDADQRTEILNRYLGSIRTWVTHVLILFTLRPG
jgi:cell division protein FtsL